MKAKKVLFSIMFWAVSLTWGIIMTVVGLLVTGVLNLIKFAGKVAGYDLKIQTHVNGCSLITEVRGNWGGVSLGAVAFCGYYSKASSTRRHEFGHSIQNLYLGPLFLFVVALPSVFRCGLYNFATYREKKIYAWGLGIGVLLAFIILLICLCPFLIGLVISACLLAYWVGFLIWFLFFELPKFKNSTYGRDVDYDSIWFEGNATKVGTKFIDWLESNP